MPLTVTLVRSEKNDEELHRMIKATHLQEKPIFTIAFARKDTDTIVLREVFGSNLFSSFPFNETDLTK